MNRKIVNKVNVRAALSFNRPAALLALLLSVSCDVPPPSDTGSTDNADVIAAARAEMRVQRADSLAERLIARSDSALQSVDPLSGREHQLLRRFGQNDHLAHARRLGIDRLPDRRVVGGLMWEPPQTSGVVHLRTNDFYIIDPRMSYAVALAAPAAAHLMERIGGRFQQDLLAGGVPPYLFIITNILRTGTDHAHLRGTNANAAQGTSAHEYGTTFDVYYGRFHYAAAHDSLARRASGQVDVDEARFRQRLRRAYRDLGRSRAAELRAILGRTLIDLQEEGLLLVMYERQQPVFHVTVARDVESAAPGGAGGLPMRRFFANVESQLADVDDDIENLDEQIDASQQRLQESLSQLKQERDMLWQQLDRLAGLSDSPFGEAKSNLRRNVASLEGKIARTRLESIESRQGVQSRLMTHFRGMDRALSQLEAQVAHGPREIRIRYEERVSDLRSQHDEFRRLLQDLEDVSEAETESARDAATAAAARLVTDLQMVVADVNDAGE